MSRLSPERWASAPTFSDFLEAAVKNADLWSAMYRTARLPEGFVERAREIPGRWKLLVLAEDWCGDAVNVVPLLARLAEAVPSIELRVVGRDSNPDLMNAHLTGTARAIPVVIVYDESLDEVGWWGPRPRELQGWFDAEGRALEKPERYKRIRQWMARDRGRSTLEEILAIVEGAVLPR
jgi:Thioredoxin